MAVIAHHAAFKLIRIRSDLKHVQIVVALDKKCIQPQQIAYRIAGIISQVGTYRNRTIRTFYTVSDRTGGVVQIIERQNRKISDGQPFVRLDRMVKLRIDLPFFIHTPDLVESLLWRVDRHVKALLEYEESARMIGMFMGDHKSCQCFGGDSERLETFLDALTGDAGIHQDARAASADQRAVAAASAGDTCQFHSYLFLVYGLRVQTQFMFECTMPL